MLQEVFAGIGDDNRNRKCKNRVLYTMFVPKIFEIFWVHLYSVKKPNNVGFSFWGKSACSYPKNGTFSGFKHSMQCTTILDRRGGIT